MSCEVRNFLESGGSRFADQADQLVHRRYFIVRGALAVRAKYSHQSKRLLIYDASALKTDRRWCRVLGLI